MELFPNTLENSLLKEGYDSLLVDYEISINGLEVSNLYLECSYVYIQLNNGEVGIAQNYAREGFSQHLPHFDPEWYRDHVLSKTRRLADLLADLFKKKSLNYIDLAILSAILAALSGPIIKQEANDGLYQLSRGFVELDDLAQPNDTVAIIGFGGHLEPAFISEKITTIHLADFKYQHPEGKSIIDEELKTYKNFKNKKLYIHDGSDNRPFLHECDIVCTTGSALCNGSLEGMLNASSNAREIIVTGHSGTLLPSVYWKHNVSVLELSIPDPAFLHKATPFFQSKDTQGLVNLMDDYLIPYKITRNRQPKCT